MGELVLSASGRFRGRETGCDRDRRRAVGLSVPYLLRLGVDVGAVADSLARAPFVVLGAAIAVYFAWQRTQ